MTPTPRIALIVNTADQPDYLSRVLRAIQAQSLHADQVVLADDGSGEDTRKLFADWSTGKTFTTAHVWQNKEGFRRARILNQAIVKAQGDYLVFLDGDTVPHPKFMEDHSRLARQGFFVQGHRALINQEAARWFGLRNFNADRRRALWHRQVQGIKHAYRWPAPWQRVRHDLRGVRGCNLGIWREHLIEVNGYNEAFIGWGREDSELAVRLMNLGAQRLDVRGWALCFHLWHLPAGRDTLPANDDLLAQAQRNGASRCDAGLAQYLQLPDR